MPRASNRVPVVAVNSPQKLLELAGKDGTRVSYTDPACLGDSHGIDGQDDRLEQSGSALDGLATGE